MRVQNIFDIAVFDSGLADHIVRAISLPQAYDNEFKTMKISTTRIAFVPHPAEITNQKSKAVAWPLETT